jgi:hypothetical protein
MIAGLNGIIDAKWANFEIASSALAKQLRIAFDKIPANRPKSPFAARGTFRHNFTQLHPEQNKAAYNKVFQSRPVHPKLFHVEQFAILR